MSVRERAAVVATTTMMSIGFLLAAAPAALAQVGDVGAKAVKVRGPFSTYGECLVVQNEYRRYYTITYYCRYVPSSGYYFNYENGR